ncbi:MAG TPA: phage baseplate assembly protein V [Bryobacteraceae bacterium]
MIDTMERLENSIESIKKKVYGVMTGRVINDLDPLTLGRVQVQLPAIDSVDLSPWARVAVLMAGPLHGTYMIPNIGDEVLVAFEQGDVNAPYVIGSLWSAMSPPPLPSPVPQIRVIKTLAQNQIMITEVPPSITIQVLSTGQTILISPTGIQILSGANVVNLGPPTGPPTVQVLSGSNVINMSPDGVTVTGSPNLNLTASGVVNITGTAINITGGLVKIN